MNQLRLIAHEVLETELNDKGSDQGTDFDLDNNQQDDGADSKQQEQQIQTNSKQSSSQTKVVIKPKDPIKAMGVASNGLKFGKFEDQFVYIVDLELSLRQIDHYNKSSHAC